ncbi:YrhB domain-containing protein [Streptomyces mutabilis]|uniref:YrhB domain-containing protein n=1 Tax=Streptomyces mutabilis TaxID=67332 RepID=UPI0039865AB2
MIEREAAVRAVEDQLERDYQQWRAAGADALRMAVVDVEEHELVWIVSWTSERFVRTRNPEFMLGGNGPYLVDRVDGGLHRVGVVSAVTGEWEADYRARIRGLPVRTAVDDLHDALCEVTAARGRVHAVRTLRRRLPMFSPAEAIEYVSALLDGAAPARLVAVATEALVEPLNPVLAVETVLGGAETRAGHRPEGRRESQSVCRSRAPVPSRSTNTLPATAQEGAAWGSKRRPGSPRPEPGRVRPAPSGETTAGEPGQRSARGPRTARRRSLSWLSLPGTAV